MLRTLTIRSCKIAISVSASGFICTRIRQRISRERDRLRRRLAVVNRVPELFGDERHERRQQPQRAFEDADQILISRAGLVAIIGGQARLDQLQIPVAIFAPEEVIDHVRGFVEAICLQRVVNLLRHPIEARKNPAIFQSLGFETADTLCAVSPLCRR